MRSRSPDPLRCPGTSATSRCLVLLLAGFLSHAAFAQTEASEDWNAKFQATFVWQSKRPFSAAYSGEHSLLTSKEKSYSFTATMALGYRPWSGAEIYLNPEVAQGVPLSALAGLGGFTNGEITRSSGTRPKLYRARLFLRKTWGFGGGEEAVESDLIQLAGKVDKRRLTMTIGNLSVTDLFDGNAYSHDPRVEFLNWSIMTHGAYDFAADARGYSQGAAIEYFFDEWALRFGRFALPKEPNQQALDLRLFKHFGDQVEIGHSHAIDGQPGKVRLLLFRNVATMSRYQDALNYATQFNVNPDINQVRFSEQVKRGIGINIEQAVSPEVGLFVRAMRADGKTETYAFTEIDRSVSGGTLIKGTRWGRELDTVGVAFSRNELSSEHRQYVAAGGLGFFIGDGRINYRAESIVEGFYKFGIDRNFWITFDGQFIRNPAYNADRGPAKVGSIRMHAEF